MRLYTIYEADQEPKIYRFNYAFFKKHPEAEILFIASYIDRTTGNHNIAGIDLNALRELGAEDELFSLVTDGKPFLDVLARTSPKQRYDLLKREFPTLIDKTMNNGISIYKTYTVNGVSGLLVRDPQSDSEEIEAKPEMSFKLPGVEVPAALGKPITVAPPVGAKGPEVPAPEAEPEYAPAGGEPMPELEPAPKPAAKPAAPAAKPAAPAKAPAKPAVKEKQGTIGMPNVPTSGGIVAKPSSNTPASAKGMVSKIPGAKQSQNKFPGNKALTPPKKPPNVGK